MRKALSVLTSLWVGLAAAHTCRSESTCDYAVQASASVQVQPAQIKLSWLQDSSLRPASYTIFRRDPASKSWGTGIKLPGSATNYLDKNVAVGKPYEYQIVKSSRQVTGYGYLYAGINVPLTEDRGKLLLVVDNTCAVNLAPELSRLEQDLVGDGWTVVRLDVNRSDSAQQVKSLIKAQYQADPGNVKSVFLFGHVPVPYSGDIVPDGHAPDHQGAWPADGFYGDMDGKWTDYSVKSTVAIDPRNKNVPGDGKFDQVTFPAPLKLMVGRVDLSNLPGRLTWGGPATFPAELDLLRNYLNKDHNFRTRQFDVPRRAVVGDYFGTRNGEAFAASGWRNFSTFFGAENVETLADMGTWIPSLAKTAHLWAYGCGAGSYTSIEGLGNSDPQHDGVTTELMKNDPKSVFTLLFGSWLGDWDSEDNVQRSILALPSYGLACAWSGRPHWFLHHMALGEPIGFSARLTQNNTTGGMYQTQVNSCAGQTHIALMGDPTLRMHVVAPPADVQALTNGDTVTLTWNCSQDDVLGYNIYSAPGPKGPFQRVNAEPVRSTKFETAIAANYMVRAIKHEVASSGSYLNLSQGAFLAPLSSPAPVASPIVNNQPVETSNTTHVASAPLTPTGAAAPGATVWFDDSLPTGAQGAGAGGDSWNWVASNPAPYNGAFAHQSSLAPGVHEHYFGWASDSLTVNAGESLFAYVYIDPANPPSELMLQWFDGNSWDHRAYWGANNIGYGVDGTTSRRSLGALPAAGQWVCLQVPASQVGLEGATVSGMAFSQFDGRATWDYTGKSATTLSTGSSTTTTTGSGTTASGSAVTNSVTWFDDTLPDGAQSGAEGGDSWTWINSNPAPYSGGQSFQSPAASGLHQQYFGWATKTLTVNAGENLFAYIYIDPNAIPSEVMLQWNDGTWDHRAYWGANNIQYGVDGTVNRRYMGPVPAAGGWVRLEVPANQVGLEGSTVNGMAFTLYDGGAAWDLAGKTFTTKALSGGSTGTGSGSSTSGTSTSSGTIVSPTVWIDDALPPGAQAGSDGGDSWNWVNSNPSPFSGGLSHQSSLGAGVHQHYFGWASQPLTVNAGETLFAYVYIDPANPPGELMLQWTDGSSWDHRAYWGANNMDFGADGTASRRNMGAMPASGQWVCLQVPASQVGLEGATITGMAFSQFDGRATWDYAGKGLVSGGSSGSGNTSTNSGSTPPAATNNVPSTVWFDDALPAGALTGSDGGDSWNWVNSNPTPFSGSLANQSSIGVGEHQHYFSWATDTLTVNAGEVLYAYVYLDPVNTPTEVMLQWNDGSWDHRAYWGANRLIYGTDATPSRLYVGPLPAAGQWIRLEVPASQLGLEGSTISGMAFTLVDGRATWDATGKAAAAIGASTGNTGGGTTGNGSGTGTTNPPPVTSTNSIGTVTNGGTGSTNSIPTSGTNSTQVAATNALPGTSQIDYLNLQVPQIGDSLLHVITPTLLELKLITTKQPDAAVTDWNFVDSNSQLSAPPASAFAVTANGQNIGIASVGFKRRPIYAPFSGYDLRIENSLYLQLTAPVSDNQAIEVKNPDGSLWDGSKQFTATVDPLRYSPAIHVNQEGYMPNYTKKAMVGYYSGSMGEVVVPSSSGFKIVDANTGAQVFQGTLTARPDSGYTYSPTPYQKVYEADFSSFNTPGQYRLVVPGMGGSTPFVIDPGVAMDFARAYALGLYHQRCGTNTAMPYTRFTHDKCHTAAASIPLPQSSYPATWNFMAGYANTINGNNPPQAAPALTSPSAMLFPYQNQGPVDVSGGHHDAGDYSKYTINSASLIHYLMFEVDSLPGVGALDNLGIPESGDGISDVMQEAKWEADFLAKMQDSDGGFYFLVYPRDREYETAVPEKGDAQIVWPKTTAVTAAAVAALAQCASSPLFKRTYPETAALYLQKAQLGWQFLLSAISDYGKNGAYQKLTHYGDDFADNDELAWAACQIFLATGDSNAHQLLKAWFDPSDPSTWRWGWWHMSQCYGHAIRSYAFAVQSGRVASASQLDATFLASSQAQITAAGDDVVAWAQQSAYGSSFPENTKHVLAAGWYFSTDQAFDIAVAYQVSPKSQYINAMISNMNYEGGCNPVNVCYITGLGWKRQRDVVNQWALYDSKHVLPPTGEPVGNITASFTYLWVYGGVLEALCFPANGAATAPYPFYDRWGDSWNVNAEFVVLNSARSLGTLAFLAAQTSLQNQAWKAPANATISVPASVVPVGSNVTLSVSAPGVDLTAARITWEARDQEPSFGSTFTFAPKNNGVQWVEAEAQLPDGRRVFATGSFSANSPNLVWVDDNVPLGATTAADGGDAWTWVSSNPAPYAGTKAHQSALSGGAHQHYFSGATATMSVGSGDQLYAWVYLDPANPPSELMLQWNDGSWEHRAYWGANTLTYGLEGTPGHVYAGPLPQAGQWVQLKVTASQLGLENSTVSGMAFSAYGGKVTWDAAGRLSPATVAVNAATNLLPRYGENNSVFTFVRSGDTNVPVAVNYSVSGTAVAGVDYQLGSSSTLMIPAGATTASLPVAALPTTSFVPSQTINLTLAPNSSYLVGNPNSASMTLAGNTVPARLKMAPEGATLTWNSDSSRKYQVSYKNDLREPAWTKAGQITAAGGASTFVDTSSLKVNKRFYLVAQVD